MNAVPTNNHVCIPSFRDPALPPLHDLCSLTLLCHFLFFFFFLHHSTLCSLPLLRHSLFFFFFLPHSNSRFSLFPPALTSKVLLLRPPPPPSSLSPFPSPPPPLLKSPLSFSTVPRPPPLKAIPFSTLIQFFLFDFILYFQVFVIVVQTLLHHSHAHAAIICTFQVHPLNVST